jgi:hypothetical protein
MELQEIIIAIVPAIITATLSYLVTRHQGKTDIKKLDETNKSEIDKLIKQHEINLEAIKEQHKLEMEAKEKEQEYKLQLMQKEYELKVQEQQQTKAADIMTGAFGGLLTNVISNPDNALKNIQALKELGEQLKSGSNEDITK